MTKYFIAGISVLFAVITFFPFMALSQSSRCVILQKEGSKALVSCNGGQTRYIDIRGRSEIYNVGDTIEASDIEARPQQERSGKQK